MKIFLLPRRSQATGVTTLTHVWDYNGNWRFSQHATFPFHFFPAGFEWLAPFTEPPAATTILHAFSRRPIRYEGILTLRHFPTISLDPTTSQGTAQRRLRGGGDSDILNVKAGHEVVPAGNSDKTVIRERLQSDEMPPSAIRMGWQAAAESLLGQQLDHFQIETLVGIGGMGAVFRGQDLRLNRDVAIKAIPAAGRDPEAMRRFRFEAQSAAKLDHPNIARVYYVGETSVWSYIVFEFVEGINLRELVLRQGPLQVDQSVFLVRQVAQALQHASQRQVVHRDIKPSNIVLTPAGQAKIVDMGLARATEMDRSTNDLTASGVTLGTFDYISPEQAHDPRDADVRSDLYSLGCTWYFLLTGSPPFPDGTALQKLLMHGTKMPEDPRIHRPDLSESLIAILKKMIAKKPGDRYQQPVDLIDDLQTLAVMENLVWTRDTDPRESVDLPVSSNWRSLVPFVAYFVAIVAIAFWLKADAANDSMFEIPQPVIRPASGLNASTVTEAESEKKKDWIVSVPADSGSVVLDPSFTKDQLDTNRQLTNSLDQAIERINLTPDTDRIILNSDKVISTGSLRTLNRNRSKLTLQSKSGSRCRIVIDMSVNDSSDLKCWFDATACHLTFENCDILWRVNDVRQTLFLCRPGSIVQLKNSTVRVDSTIPRVGNNAFPTLVRCDASSGSAVEEKSSISATRFLITNCSFIGPIDLLQAVNPVRLESPCAFWISKPGVGSRFSQMPRWRYYCVNLGFDRTHFGC